MKDITPDRWKQVEALIDRALDLDPSERESFLERNCADDPELRSLVDNMLRASDASDDFLETGDPTKHRQVLQRMADELGESDEAEPDPRMVGPYRLIRKLGRGGMGQVYLAVRDDEAFRRYVAVKVIRRGMDTEDILRRFRNERQILASLTHPNIARLLDGGATSDGLSYFVMEYVEGTLITKYCNENTLRLEQRLDLFEQVCSAVHYAHQNLIVHRDLKPSNILVGSGGTVKLLDFGIAKFLNPDLTGFTMPMTSPEMRVMTPEYASPEQVKGASVTTASDVYQLGVLLYELLTGHRPFTFETTARDEIKKIILEKDPERPSTAITRLTTQGEVNSTVTPQTVSQQRRTPLDRLRRELSGDLDRIVLMALRKEIDRRYQSADQLLEDIRRYRQGLPVNAQSPTWSYRAWKFVRRHRIGVTFTASIAVLLIAVSILAVRFAVVTAEQAEQIEIEAEKTEQVKNFVVGLFERANPEYVRGRDVSPKDLLMAGLEDVDEDLEDQPEIKAEVLSTAGLVLADMGEFVDARPLLEESLDLREELAGDNATVDLAESLYQMGYILDEVGELDSAIDYYERALEMQVGLHGQRHLSVAQTRNDLGVAVYSAGDYERGIQLWEQALQTRRALLDEPHLDIAETMSNLAQAFNDKGRQGGEGAMDRAEELYRSALAMVRRVEGDDHPLVASNLHNLGTLKLDVGSLDEADALFQEALQIRTKLYGERHDNTARTINLLGRVAHRRGRFEEAERRYRESLDIHRELYGEMNFYVGVDISRLASLARDRSNLQEAARLYGQAITSLSVSLGSEHVRTGLVKISLAQTYREMGQYESAIRPAREALDIFVREWGEDDPDVNNARFTLARCLVEVGRAEEAKPLLEKSLVYYEQAAADRIVREIEGLLRRVE